MFLLNAFSLWLLEYRQHSQRHCHHRSTVHLKRFTVNQPTNYLLTHAVRRRTNDSLHLPTRKGLRRLRGAGSSVELGKGVDDDAQAQEGGSKRVDPRELGR